MSSKKTLHPSVKKFKEFVKTHPELAKEVKEKRKTWQDIYEEWYILGEEDEVWKNYESSTSLNENISEEKTTSKNSEKNDFMSTIFHAIKNMDLNQMQHNISTASEAISNIQQLIKQFQGTPSHSKPSSPKENTHPFFFNKD
jgi:hypothetical protein